MTSSRHPLPSERKFGFLFVAVFCSLAAYAHYKGWHVSGVAALLLGAGILLLIALFKPAMLSPLNKAWFWLGLAMGKIVSPVVLGIIFYLLITPVALLGRLFGRDELRLARSPKDSYWIDRSPPGPDPASFKNQF